MATTKTDSLATPIAILPANKRNGLVFENTDANRCHILLGAGTVSVTNYSFSLAQNSCQVLSIDYDGPVNAIWAADGAGSLYTTEL